MVFVLHFKFFFNFRVTKKDTGQVRHHSVPSLPSDLSYHTRRQTIMPINSQEACTLDSLMDGLNAPCRTTGKNRNHSRNQFFDDLYNAAYSRTSIPRHSYCLSSSNKTPQTHYSDNITQNNMFTLNFSSEPCTVSKDEPSLQFISPTSPPSLQNTSFNNNSSTQKYLNNKNRSSIIRSSSTFNPYSTSLVRYNQSPSLRYSNLMQPQSRRSVAELTKVMFLRPKKYFNSDY